MKTKLFNSNQRFQQAFVALSFCLCFSFGWSQNLMVNPGCDAHGTATGSSGTTTDNADSYDMTPNLTILDESGATVPSPYRAIWFNDSLEKWLQVFYLGSLGSIDEQPGSTSSGRGGQGVKLYDDGNPVITGCSRRIYQQVNGLLVGGTYTFSIDSYSEAVGTNSEVYIFNKEIYDEVGINTNGGSDSAVAGFRNITNDLNRWATNTITFVATDTFAIVYVRSLNSVDGTTEVFYDNFSMVYDGTASLEEFTAASISVFPNPSSEIINIQSKNGFEIASVVLSDVAGKQIINTQLVNNTLNVSELPKGIYFLRILSDTGNAITKKVIIE